MFNISAFCWFFPANSWFIVSTVILLERNAKYSNVVLKFSRIFWGHSFLRTVGDQVCRNIAF